MRKHNFNEKKFSIVDTENKAYWLGFLYADGCNEFYPQHYTYFINLTLKESDKNHIEKFRTWLESTHPIFKTKSCYGINIHSKEMCNDLIKLGCVPRKSYKQLHIPDIQQDLIRHFIRGYFDGDGGIHIRKHDKLIIIYFSGSETLLEEFKIILNKITNRKASVRICSNKNITFQLQYTGKYAKRFLKYIYRNSNIYLDRKYQLYKNNI